MKFLKQISFYTLVGLISAGINFFVMPILSHYLSPSDYGVLALFNTYVTILIPVLSVSAYSLLMVDFFKEKNKEIFATYFNSIQLIPLVNTAILALVFWNWYGRFADDLELRNAGSYWGYVILALTLLSIYCDQFLQFLILQKKAGAYAMYSLLKVALEVGLTFFFVVYKGLGWEGRIYSWLIVSILVFIAGFVYFYREGLIKFRVSIRYIRQGLVFGSPLVLHGIGKLVVNQSDRLFIVKMIPNGIYEAGIYSIGYTVGSLVMIAVNAFFNFYSPYLMERLSNLTEEKRLQIVKMGYWYLLGSIVLLVLITVAAPVLFRYFIDPQYYEGTRYVFWVALGYCFWGGYMFFSGFIFYLKKSGILGWMAIFNVGTNLLFNYFFIKIFGAIGAAYATALSFFLIMLFVGYIANRLIPMPWKNVQKARAISLS
jgi:O-antigen/teichoic acid export membrane protein